VPSDPGDADVRPHRLSAVILPERPWHSAHRPILAPPLWRVRPAALKARLKRIDNAQNSKILELEELPADPADTAAAAMRTRIRARFADLHTERQQIETQLQALEKTTPTAADPALLDQLPLVGDILPGLPPALKARLFQTFDMEVLWNKPGQHPPIRQSKSQ
jgi:hypothetical protein